MHSFQLHLIVHKLSTAKTHMNIVSYNSAYKNLQYAIYKSLSAAAYNSFSNITVVGKLSISTIACLMYNSKRIALQELE